MLLFFMHLPLDNVGKSIKFLAVSLPRSSVHSPGQISLPQYLRNGLSSLDETYGEYSLDLVRFWTSKVKVTAGCRGDEGIHVDVEVLKSIQFVTC